MWTNFLADNYFFEIKNCFAADQLIHLLQTCVGSGGRLMCVIQNLIICTWWGLFFLNFDCTWMASGVQILRRFILRFRLQFRTRPLHRNGTVCKMCVCVHLNHMFHQHVSMTRLCDMLNWVSPFITKTWDMQHVACRFNNVMSIDCAWIYATICLGWCDWRTEWNLLFELQCSSETYFQMIE